MRSFVVLSLLACTLAAPLLPVDQVKRSPQLTGALQNLPAVGGVTQELGSVLSPVTQGVVPTVLNTVDGLPGGSVVTGAAKEALSVLGNVKRQAITGILTKVPGVEPIVQTLGTLLNPVTGQLLPEVEQQLKGLPGGDAVVGLVNSLTSTLANVKRDDPCIFKRGDDEFFTPPPIGCAFGS